MLWLFVGKSRLSLAAWATSQPVRKLDLSQDDVYESRFRFMATTSDTAVQNLRRTRIAFAQSFVTWPQFVASIACMVQRVWAELNLLGPPRHSSAASARLA